MSLRALFRLAASITLFTLVMWFIGPDSILSSFAAADPRWLAAGLACTVLGGVCAALRWHALAAWLGVHVPRREMLLAYWRGVMANAVLPGATIGGDTLRTLHLQGLGHHLAHSAASVVLDRLSGVWVLAVMSLSLTAAALALGLLPPALAGAPATVAALLALLALSAPLLAWTLSAAAIRRLPGRAAALLDALRARPRPLRQYVAQLLWSGGVQCCAITAFTCGGYAVGLDLPWWQFAIAAGPIFIIAALPLGVGGWGTREAAAALVLGALGAAHDAAVACAILYGLFATLQGLLGALSLLRTKGKSDGRPENR